MLFLYNFSFIFQLFLLSDFFSDSITSIVFNMSSLLVTSFAIPFLLSYLFLYHSYFLNYVVLQKLLFLVLLLILQ